MKMFGYEVFPVSKLLNQDLASSGVVADCNRVALTTTVAKDKLFAFL